MPTRHSFLYLRYFSLYVDLISDGTDCVCSSERQMGIEREYLVDVKGFCPACENEYQVTGEVWEYPENCYNYEQEIRISKLNE